MKEFSRLDEVLMQISTYASNNDARLKRTNELLQNIAITNAYIYDKLNEISKEKKNEYTLDK